MPRIVGRTSGLPAADKCSVTRSSARDNAETGYGEAPLLYIRICRRGNQAA